MFKKYILLFLLSFLNANVFCADSRLETYQPTIEDAAALLPSDIFQEIFSIEEIKAMLQDATAGSHKHRMAIALFGTRDDIEEIVERCKFWGLKSDGTTNTTPAQTLHSIYLKLRILKNESTFNTALLYLQRSIREGAFPTTILIIPPPTGSDF